MSGGEVSLRIFIDLLEGFGRNKSQLVDRKVLTNFFVGFTIIFGVDFNLLVKRFEIVSTACLSSAARKYPWTNHAPVCNVT